jgi:hypothetical protein
MPMPMRHKNNTTTPTQWAMGNGQWAKGRRLQACSHYKIFINCLSTPTVAIFNGEITTEVVVAIDFKCGSHPVTAW